MSYASSKKRVAWVIIVKPTKIKKMKEATPEKDRSQVKKCARRTKIIPCFLTEKSALKLVFSVLIRATKRWRKVSFTKIELNCLDKLKEELGIREGFQNKQDKQELKGVC